MLTVKVYDESGARAGYCCDSYQLVPPGTCIPGDNSTTGEPGPRIVLSDEDGDVRYVVRPASGTTIYIMNALGKTVDTLHFDRFFPKEARTGDRAS